MKKPADRGAAAFTLVELLVVVAIVAVLAALIVPSVNAARAIAKRMQCTSQMRQLYIGMSAWSADNGNYFLPALGATGVSTPGGKRLWFQADSTFGSYVGGDAALEKITVCPVNWTGQTVTLSGTTNPHGYTYVVNYSVMALPGGPSYDSSQWIKRTRVVAASRTVMLTDFDKSQAWGIGFNLPSDGAFARVGAIHAGKVNTLWCDGHVTAEEKDNLTADNISVP